MTKQTQMVETHTHQTTEKSGSDQPFGTHH